MFWKKEKENPAPEPLLGPSPSPETSVEECPGNSEIAESTEDSRDSEESENAGSPEASEPEEESAPDFAEQAEGFLRGAGISTEEFDSAMECIAGISDSYVAGKFNPDHLSLILQAMRFDDELLKAREEGVIEGRNQQITEAFRDLRARRDEDEIPRFGGTPGIGSADTENTIFDLARNARR